MYTTRKTFSHNPAASPVMFLQGCRFAYDTIACSALPISLRGLLAFAFLLVLYAYRALRLGCVAWTDPMHYTECICAWSSRHDFACFYFPSSAFCTPVAYLKYDRTCNIIHALYIAFANPAMAQGQTLEPRNATRQTPFCNPDAFPLMFLEEPGGWIF